MVDTSESYHDLVLVSSRDGSSFKWLEQEQTRLLPVLPRVATRIWSEGMCLHMELPLTGQTLAAVLAHGMGEKRSDDWLAIETVLAELETMKELTTTAERMVAGLVAGRSVSNCIGLWKMARRLRMRLLEAQMQAYVMDVLVRAVQHRTIDLHFYRLTPQEVRLLLGHDGLRVRNELDVRNVLVAWTEAWPERRGPLLPEMMRLVRKDGVPQQTELGYELDEERKGRSPAENVLVVGGWEEGPMSDFLLLDYVNDRWQKSAVRMPYVAAYHGAVWLNDELYIFGGGDNMNAHYNQLFKLTRQMQWQQLASMRERRCYITNSSVQLNGQIWVMGGHNGSRAQRTRLRTVERYDPATDVWTLSTPMRHSRSDAAAAAVSGKIFVCGGFNGRELLSQVEWMDPFSEVWHEMSQMPSPRAGLCLIADGLTSLVALGGFSGTDRFATVWKVDVSQQDGRWVELPPMKSPRSNFTVSKIGDDLVVAGGYHESTIGTVEYFDGTEWRDGPQLPKGRSALRAVAVSPDWIHRLLSHHPF